MKATELLTAEFIKSDSQRIHETMIQASKLFGRDRVYGHIAKSSSRIYDLTLRMGLQTTLFGHGKWTQKGHHMVRTKNCVPQAPQADVLLRVHAGRSKLRAQLRL